MSYAELQVATHFSFLRGASSPDELFARAKELGLAALGICDRHSLAGMVRAHIAAKAHGVRLIVGTRLDLDDGTALLVYPTDRPAYSRLCRLLSRGKARAGKGRCDLGWRDLVEFGAGQIVILLPGDDDPAFRLRRLARDFGDRAYLALTLRRRPNDAVRLAQLEAEAAAAGVATVATGDVLYHLPTRRMLQDVMTCIREGVTIDTAGFRRERSADRQLFSPAEMAHRFARHGAAFARTSEIMARCRFSLDDLCYQYPLEDAYLPGLAAQPALEKLTWEGAARRYPAGVPDKVTAQLRHELALIGELGYAPYFLTVHAIVRFAKSQAILCQGRGSAANSAVCFVLGITAIDPVHHDLLFERFISTARREPPDIDVDFEHERREEVIQWIYETYGRDHAALTATVIRYRGRGALREVAKAMGLSADLTQQISALVRGWGWAGEDGPSTADLRALNLNIDDRRLKLTLELTRQLVGMPRHLSQHPGGFVLTQDRLDDLVPIEPAAMDQRQVIEWDKDDIDELKFMKVDVLGLGMLGCLRRAFDLLATHRGRVLDLAAIPAEDPATYAMIQRADTVGVFQIESRAQMAMLPRLKPATFYDLVIEVAIVRPGPIQGDMVHPYLRRRQGKEPVEFPTAALKNVLGKTLGVPLFQEQAMRVAIECAGFSPTDADRLRRSMATFKHTGGVHHFRAQLMAGMVERGFTPEFAERTCKQLEGFGSYGFPESHAASFALLAYASSWLKCHHPEVYCCAILNAQPMGFYAPAQLVRDARDHGVEVHPVCVNTSRWDSTLEPAMESNRRDALALRLGLRLAKGFANADGARLIAARADRPFADIDDVWRRSGLGPGALERLAEADAFAGLGAGPGLDRRQALWAIKGLGAAPLPLFAQTVTPEPDVTLIPLGPAQDVVEDYRAVGLTLRAHPVSFLRPALDQRRIRPCASLVQARDGQRTTVAGLVLMRQRPGSASGVLFVTLEDETGIANLVVWPQLFERERRTVLGARLLSCRGRVQKEGLVIHLVADRFEDLTELLSELDSDQPDLRIKTRNFH